MMSASQTVGESVSQARAAQAEWRQRSVKKRLRVIGCLRSLIAGSCEALALTAVNEAHPVEEVLLSEVLPLLEACNFLQNTAEQLLRTRRLGGRGRPLWLGGIISQIEREPLGVVGVISPSNYPLFLAGVQILQALVAGNAVIWKPAPGCLSVSQEFERLLLKSGLPENLLKVLPDTLESGVDLTSSKIDKLVFTGGFQTGRNVLERLAHEVIPAIVELSGFDPVFVRDDADLETVAKALQFGLTLNRGRTCMAPRRVFASPSILEKLEIILKERFSKNVEGNTWPVRHENDQRLSRLVHGAIKHGARIVYGGIKGDEMHFPCVLSDMSEDMEILGEDLFCPVLFLMAVDSEEAAISLSAKSEYALSASIFSKDLDAAERMSRRVKAGLVSVNDLIVPSADPRIPFGGSGKSGYGVTRGAEGLLSLTRPKVIQVRATGGVRHFETNAVDVGMVAAVIRILHGRGFGVRLDAIITLFRKGFSSILRGPDNSKLENAK